MIHVLVIPAWYDIGNPIAGIFFHDYCNAMTSQCKVTLLNFEPHSFSERFKKDSKEDKIKNKKYHFLKMDYYNPFPGKLFGLNAKFQRKMMLKQASSLIDNYMKQAGKIDVIHIQSVCNNMTPIIAVELSKQFNIPYLVTEHYTSFEEAGDDNYVPYSTFNEIKTIVTKASMRIAVSDFASSYCAKCFGVGFETVYNIISNSFLGTNLHTKNKRNSPFSFLCIGDLKKRKGQLYLLQSFAQIVSHCNEITLTLIGKGDDGPALLNLAKELGIEDKVKIYNFLPTEKFIEVMDAANVIVSASEAELFGLTIVEGFFRGKPALATRSGGPEELINATNGLITNYADVNGMAENMKYMYDHYEDYNPKAISDEAMSKFSEKAIVPIMINNYKKVIEKK
jgi:glycosyltransferase involved in cell wall biosynthesis